MFTRDDLTPGLQFKYDQNKMDFTKNLQMRAFCTKPFDTISITPNGLVYACECDAWLPISVGHIFEFHTLNDIMISDTTLELQKSIADRSFRYCDVKNCGFNELMHGNYQLPTNHLRYLNIGLDRSCNLSCPSCRESLVFHKAGKEYETSVMIAQHLGSLIREHADPLNFTLATDGEVFASHIYAAMLKEIDLHEASLVRIMTNGTLMKDHWNRVERIERNISHVQVSMDAGTKTTFEKIRRGGRWEKAIESIAFVRQKKIPISISIVVQPDNVHELVQAANLYMSMGASMVYFSMEQDWGTKTDFTTVNMREHPLNSLFNEQIEKLRYVDGVKLDNSIFAFPDHTKASSISG